MARAARIAQPSLSQFERAVHEPAAGTLGRLAVALQVSTDYLTGLTDDPAPAALLSARVGELEDAGALAAAAEEGHHIDVLEVAPAAGSGALIEGERVTGERLAAARQRAGLKQVELAVALGDRYNQPMISMVESGQRDLRAEGVKLAARELRVSTDYLYGLTDEPAPPAQLASELVSARKARNFLILRDISRP